MSRVIGVCSPSFSKNHGLRSLLAKEFSDWKINFCESSTELSTKELVRFLEDTEVAIVGKEQIGKQLLSELPTLRAIAKYGVGLDSIDFSACDQHKVKVYHTPGVNRHAVAEITIGMMLSVLRNISLSDRLLKQGIWRKDGGQQLWSKTVGIIGCGAVGSEVARLLTAFKCRVLVCDILDKTDFCSQIAAIQLPLDELLSESHIVSLHIPLTELTKHLIGSTELNLMGPQSILINTSRGTVLDQSQLKFALKTHKILAAAIDVFESEPCTDQELLSLENLLATPHIAGNASECVEAMGKAAISGVRDFVLSQN